MADEDQGQQMLSRTDHFADAADTSTPMRGTSPATSIPQATQADPAFHGGSALEIPNTIRSVNGLSDRSYMQSMLPYADKTSPMVKAQQGEQAPSQEI